MTDVPKAIGYDPKYFVAKRRGKAHLLGMTNAFTYTGFTLCKRDSAPYNIDRDGEPVCRICDKAADLLDDL